MKQLTYILAAIFMIPLFMQKVNAQFTETRDFTKRFKVDSETQIEVVNKYGKIEVNTWEKDSVVIDISIRVEEKNLSKLEKRMDEIDFDFTDSQRFLIAKTMVHTSKSLLQKELLKFKESILQSDGNVEIDYVVWVPKSNNLKLENKFGNIIIDELAGDTEIILNNGNLKAHKLIGKTTLNLSFADATINYLEDARIISNYSEWYLKFTKELNIESKQSDFEILEMTDLLANSRRDKFRVRLVSLIDATGSLSSFRINKIEDKANLRLSHGDVSMEEVNPEFSNIFIESRNTDINLTFPESSAFGFELTHTKAEIDLARSIQIDEEETLNEKTGKKRTIGSIGGQEGTKQKLFINAESGEINILVH